LKRISAVLSQPPASKKKKITGAAVLDRISDGLAAMAEAVIKGSYTETITKDTVDSTIEGQAQERVQSEPCLTVEGQLAMLDILLTPVLARTYMAIKAQQLRSLWLKKQLEKYIIEKGGELDEYFIENETQYS
jgi:hypothetical protein